ncbi:MAG TPA: adenylate/guanylate cyclase domain-containing protein [Candidatus Limnocylindrales bacterium]|nr:adenylate/guanylate cyclase domain-containing protein [Candidatus Limnocylindrales bacterium]
MARRSSRSEGAPGDIAAVELFPGANPNPVLRVDAHGTLVYANDASEAIRERLGLAVGVPVAPDLLAQLRRHAAAPELEGLEIECPARHQTFRLTAVDVPSLGAINLYGTDVTAEKVVERFPDRNPNPVLRVDEGGRLIYANTASGMIVEALGVAVGSTLPAGLVDDVWRARAAGGTIEVRGGGRVYELRPVEIPEFGFTNLYGTDVTAARAVDRFPMLNPNPVLRIARDGRLQFANPASRPILDALGVEVGEILPEPLLTAVRGATEASHPDVIELAAGERTFEILVASVYEFESINLYGTDVTAARLVERTNRENERLLLNILPPSIAQRLREGEVVIADRFDEMTVLFADVVDFTPLAARLPATDVVRLLNRIFSAFDALVDRFGLEKIKTVGDAYMVVGGLDAPGDRAAGGPAPGGAGDHAERMADMALAILDATAGLRGELGLDLQVRVGLHVGPAVAGVIGIRKFIYDVWGDTVNMASRMESHGIPGRIQVTAATAQRLSRTHAFEPRGVIDVKGRGSAETLLLVGRRD